MRAGLKTALALTAALAAMVLAISGVLDNGLDHLGLSALNRANQEYLESSYDRALEGFLVLSAVKSGLAVVEGSQVGIGFSFQVGDLVQSVYDYVNIAWKTVLAGGTVLVMTRLALAGVALVDHYVLALALGVLFCFLAVQGFFPRQRSLAAWLRSAATACAFLALCLYLVLPLSILGASKLSDAITRPLVQASTDTFDQVSRSFSFSAPVPDSDSPDTEQATPGWKERFADLKQRLTELEKTLGTQAKRLAGATFQLIAGYLFDCVLFPLAFVAVLVFFLRAVPGYLHQVVRDQRLARTIQERSAR